MQSNLRLIRQAMTNFKGARNLRFEPNGCDAAVHGANATGKTTLLDGFLWLLFDKDSAGRKDFEIKTQDTAGRASPMLDHSVELLLDKDGEQVTLRKTLSEVCEVLGPDGAPYNGGLNNAARINTGVDIINTLSAHYGMTAPLFIDNAEAVNQLIDTPCQLIRLLVSETDNALKVTLKQKGAEGPRFAGLLPDAEMPALELLAVIDPTAGPGF